MWYLNIVSKFKISLSLWCLCQISHTNHAIMVLIDLYIINFIFFSIFRKITQCKNQLQENLFIVNAVRLSGQCWSSLHCGTLQHCGLFSWEELCLPPPPAQHLSGKITSHTWLYFSLLKSFAWETQLYPMTRVSIKTEIASRFKKTNRLYAPSENIDISKPYNVISSTLETKLSTEKSAFFTKENVAFT